MNRTRLFAHPGNPDAKAAAAVAGAARARREQGGRRSCALRKGSVVSSGHRARDRARPPTARTRVTCASASAPPATPRTSTPARSSPNWAQLQKALHPQGRADQPTLCSGRTASDVFLLSRAELERTVLSDPGITVDGCSRQDISSGAVDKRVLALLAFLSRSGLRPTVGALRCGQSQYSASGARSRHYRGDAVDITAINGVPLADHQGAGSITDLTIRALLTLPAEFVPHEIISLMHYPASASTRAESSHWNRIELVFQPARPAGPRPAAAARRTPPARARPRPVAGRHDELPEPAAVDAAGRPASARSRRRRSPTSRAPSAIPDPKHK